MDFPAISHTDTHHSPETIHWNENRMRTGRLSGAAHVVVVVGGGVGIHISTVSKKWSAHFRLYKYFCCLYHVLCRSHSCECNEMRASASNNARISLNRRREIANTHVRCTVSLFSVKFRSIFPLWFCMSLFCLHCIYHRQSSFGTCSTELLYWSKQSYQPNIHSEQTHTERERESVFENIFAHWNSPIPFRSVVLCCAVREIEKIVSNGLFVYGLVERLCDTVR